MRSQLRSFEPRFAITYSDRPADPGLERRLATLPAHSIVYYLLVNQDGAGARLPSAGIPGSRRGGRQRTDLFLGRLGDGSRHRRRQPQGPEGPDRGRRPAGPARASRRGGRQHSDVVTRSECQSGRLAPVRRGASAKRASLPARSSGSGSPPSGTATSSTSSARRPSCWRRRCSSRACSFSARRRQAEEQVRGSQAELRTSYERIRDLGRGC